ncbi:MAG: SpoIIE family protein phosphatase [Ruminococcus sp.]|nr:SpoIIE family protein phosphatase [Candidatus Copronaster equi]
MINSYIKISLAGLLPVVVAFGFYLLEKHTAFGKLKYYQKQIIYGVLFGIVAIIGTDFGVPINGAQMNCRDSAVLTAGLFFGAPAGIIAGLIGGIERWFAVYWGISAYTRVACSVSTIIAGVYSALLRKYMFENKKPTTLLSLAIGVVMEVFHMTMVFITHMNTPNEAIEIVKTCSVVMIPANGLSVMFAALVLTALSKDNAIKKNSQTRISQTIQRWMLVAVCFAFVLTSLFIFKFQNEIASDQANKLLKIAVDETSADINDASDENLLNMANIIKDDIGSLDVRQISKKYSVAEVNTVNKKGIITDSSIKEFIGYDMSSGEQSKEFMCLLGKTKEYVQKYGPISYDKSIMRKYAGVKTETGFIQIGYDAENFKRDIDKQVVGITKNRHVGQTGYVLILDSGFNVISAPADNVQKNLLRTSGKIEIPEPDVTFSMTVNGVKCRCLYQITEGYYIFSVLPEAEAIQTRNVATYLNTFMEILVFAILFGLIYLLIKRVVVNQIKSINGSLAKITGGDLDEVVNVRTNEEFASLSDDINSTVDTLKKYIAEASARIDAELEFAKSIQASALPNTFPAFPNHKDFDIFASMHPAKEVGGDFYDFYITENDTLNFLIADVSGKGIPAAMFMMRAMTELKTLTEAGKSIDEVFTDGNDGLCVGNDAGMFVTAWQGGIDLTNGLVRFANAGHNPPLVRRGNGKFEYLKSRAGLVLAGMEGLKYKMQELQLEPGDVIYLYTDGVTEATNASNELYGEERLANILNACEYDDMQELCKAVKADVDKFVGEAPQFDDITMVAMKYIGIPTIMFEEAKIEDIEKVTQFVEAELEKYECPKKPLVQIKVAIDELFSNIVRYGYPDEPGPITVKIVEPAEPKAVYVRFEDEGIAYNPLIAEDPDTSLSSEERIPGGLGVFVVKETMDDVKYKYENGKNILTIKKLL